MISRAVELRYFSARLHKTYIEILVFSQTTSSVLQDAGKTTIGADVTTGSNGPTTEALPVVTSTENPICE